ncbi:MAG TPA: hypothetical protein VGD60_09945, partial [Candidatus Acidoferrales bacterium]
MKCFSCAEELPLRATFCPRCGTAVDEGESPTVTHVPSRDAAAGSGGNAGSTRPADVAGGGGAPAGGAGSGFGVGAGVGSGSGSGVGRGSSGSFGSARTSGEARATRNFTSSTASGSRTSSAGHFVAGTTLAG